MIESKKIKELNVNAKKYSKIINQIINEVKKVVVGQEDMIIKTIIALISNAHVLIEGVPGLAKTLFVRTLAKTIKADFVRIQFTPDLLPSDIIGTKIYDYENKTFISKKGPIFANFVLADEINRAPAKVQSALLEAMQERQVTIHGETFLLPKPFIVLATENPIESEGTYRLPEAQLDRFMFKILVDYPKKSEEIEILKRFTTNNEPHAKQVIDKKIILEMQKFLQNIYADEKILEYVSEIVHTTRNPKNLKYKEYQLNELIAYGASPRASIYLILGAKANALLHGRGYVLPDDIKFVAKDVLRHRIILSYEAEAEGITSDKIIEIILDNVKVP